MTRLLSTQNELNTSNAEAVAVKGELNATKTKAELIRTELSDYKAGHSQRLDDAHLDGVIEEFEQSILLIDDRFPGLDLSELYSVLRQVKGEEIATEAVHLEEDPIIPSLLPTAVVPAPPSLPFLLPPPSPPTTKGGPAPSDEVPVPPLQEVPPLPPSTEESPTPSGLPVPSSQEVPPQEDVLSSSPPPAADAVPAPATDNTILPPINVTDPTVVEAPEGDVIIDE